MMNVSKPMLRILAAITWYVGGGVLLFKAGSLILEAAAIRPDDPWTRLAAVVGIGAGMIKAVFLFRKICAKNLARIAALSQPKLWNFFRLRFYFFLFLMILTGALLSRFAHGNFPFLIGVAILDLSIGTALLGSSYVFWKRNTPAA